MVNKKPLIITYCNSNKLIIVVQFFKIQNYIYDNLIAKVSSIEKKFN